MYRFFHMDILCRKCSGVARVWKVVWHNAAKAVLQGGMGTCPRGNFGIDRWSEVNSGAFWSILRHVSYACMQVLYLHFLNPTTYTSTTLESGPSTVLQPWLLLYLQPPFSLIMHNYSAFSSLVPGMPNILQAKQYIAFTIVVYSSHSFA